MKLPELFQLEDVRLIESSFEALTNESSLVQMLRGSTEVRLLIDNDETPLAMAREDEGWKAVSFLWKEPSEDLIEILPELDIKVFKCSIEDWREAVMEYFSNKMLKECQPALDDLPADREKKVSDLIWKEWHFKPGDLCYDCCCGSGVGSKTLVKMGLRPLAYDVDRDLLCRGLLEGRLQPWNTVLLDGTKASEYLDKAPYAIMLMAGDINIINSWTWKLIVDQILELADNIIMTVATEEEVKFMEQWCHDKGRTCTIFENQRDLFYDRWVCSVR
ncbi:MAG TPA: hypothetical protein VMW85_00760 [Methanomassiliicoccales archaeon]|nr:hypothetical protein [Methanomassiliicoccales archaeon]